MIVGKTIRVLFGNSVFEDVTATIRDGVLYLEINPGLFDEMAITLDDLDLVEQEHDRDD